MSNVRSFPYSESEPDVSFGKPHVPTAGELKRAIGVMKRAIAKEAKRRALKDKLDRLTLDLHNLTTPSQF
jgi:hypothetical protein